MNNRCGCSCHSGQPLSEIIRKLYKGCRAHHFKSPGKHNPGAFVQEPKNNQLLLIFPYLLNFSSINAISASESIIGSPTHFAL